MYEYYNAICNGIIEMWIDKIMETSYTALISFHYAYYIFLSMFYHAYL